VSEVPEGADLIIVGDNTYDPLWLGVEPIRWGERYEYISLLSFPNKVFYDKATKFQIVFDCGSHKQSFNSLSPF
jgi:hypothetical protein